MRVSPIVVALLACVGLASTAHAARIACGEVTAQQGGDAVVEVSLEVTGDEQVAGMQNDLTYDPAVFAIQDADCVINPAIGPDSALGKELGTNNALMNPPRLRNLLVSLDNVDPIPSGLLYTCTFRVAADATPGDYVLDNINQRASDPQGVVVPTTASNCKVRVDPAPTPTATPRCRTNEDCPAGEVCVDGECVVATPTPTPIGFCEDDNDCPAGQVCVNNRCVTPTPTRTPIGYCTDSEDCPAGQVCVNNMCVTPTPTKNKGGGGGGCSCEIDPRTRGGRDAGDVLAVLLPAMLLALRYMRRTRQP